MLADAFPLARMKSAVELTPFTLAWIAYLPTMGLAEKAEDVAIPLESDREVDLLLLVFEKTALAPVAGAVKVTVLPGTLSPAASSTSAFSGWVACPPKGRTWDVPL